MAAAAFITFEGIDGSGKSTHLRMAASELRVRGLDVVTTREPGGTALGARLREILLDQTEPLDPLAELLLYGADRAQHVRAMIQPAINSGRLVLSDRYADATIAYQGGGRGFPSSTLANVIQIATDGLKPDLTFLFDLPVEKAKERIGVRSAATRNTDRYDSEEKDFQERVRSAYLDLAASEPDRISIVDASLPIEEVHSIIMGSLAARLSL